MDIMGDKIGGQCGQSIIVALCPAPLDREVLSFDIADLAQSLKERDNKRCNLAAGRRAAENSRSPASASAARAVGAA